MDVNESGADVDEGSNESGADVDEGSNDEGSNDEADRADEGSNEASADVCTTAPKEMTGFTGKVKMGELVVPVRWWMPNDNGGGSSMYRRVDRIEYVKPKSVRYSFKQSVLSKYFKKTRAKVTVLCLKDHALRKVTPQGDHECDMCNKEKPRWTCQGGCHYDLCTECHEMMGVQRSLLPSTRAEINNHMPNVAVDPHEEGKPPCLGDDCTWHAEFKLEKAMNVQDIALEMRVSQSHLIEHNYKEGWNLTPATVFSKGTTLWQPGGQKKQSHSGDEGGDEHEDGDEDEGDDEDGDDEDGDDKDGDDKDGYYVRQRRGLVRVRGGGGGAPQRDAHTSHDLPASRRTLRRGRGDFAK